MAQIVFLLVLLLQLAAVVVVLPILLVILAVLVVEAEEELTLEALALLGKATLEEQELITQLMVLAVAVADLVL
jgi:hypothetical protein